MGEVSAKSTPTGETLSRDVKNPSLPTGAEQALSAAGDPEAAGAGTAARETEAPAEDTLDDLLAELQGRPHGS